MVRLQDLAADLFAIWREVHARNQPDGSLASHWGKMSGLCLRLALVLKLLWWSAEGDDSSPFVVTVPAIKAAITFLNHYAKPMALRVLGAAAIPQADKGVAILAHHIQTEALTRINARIVQRTASLPRLRDVDSLKAALAVLEDTNWLQPDGVRAGGGKGRKSSDYAVNPAVLSGCNKSLSFRNA